MVWPASAGGWMGCGSMRRCAFRQGKGHDEVSFGSLRLQGLATLHLLNLASGADQRLTVPLAPGDAADAQMTDEALALQLGERAERFGQRVAARSFRPPDARE